MAQLAERGQLAAGDTAPLSYAQWRLWFLEQLRPGTNAWNTPVATRLDGPLDVDVLRHSLALLVARHRTLRTVCRTCDGNPVQALIDATDVPLPVVDVSRHEVSRLLDEEVRGPFDLESDLMLRARLLRVAVDEHVLVVVAHHIACDGWSKGLLVSELGETYAALLTGSKPELPEL